MLNMSIKSWTSLFWAAALFLAPVGSCAAGEVALGEVPAEHRSGTCRVLPWGVEVWSLEEAVSHMINEAAVLWVDTRPANLNMEGSLRRAVCMPFERSGAEGNGLSREKLIAAIASSGYSNSTVKIVFFSETTDCHRSYNAAYNAAVEWGIDPERIVWFREGYPGFFREIRDNPILRRKAMNFLSEEALRRF
jgi:hypothetical protein